MAPGNKLGRLGDSQVGVIIQLRSIRESEGYWRGGITA